MAAFSRSIFTKLPQELVDFIIECLDDDTKALRACSAVCSAMRCRSQTLLFTHHKRLSFIQPSAILSPFDRSWYPFYQGSFSRELSAPIYSLREFHSKVSNHAHLARWIREVTVAYDMLDFLQGVTGQLLHRVLAHFPRLESLTITHASAREPSFRQLKYDSRSNPTSFAIRVALAPILPTAPIRHIALRDVQMDPYHLSSCKHLRELDLKGQTNFVLASAPLPLQDAERPRLDTLRVNLGCHAFHSLIRYCAEPNPPLILSDIQTFSTKESASWTEDFPHVLTHFKNLTHLKLALTVLDGDDEHEWIDLSPLSKLTTLSFHLQSTRGKYKATRNQVQAFTRRCSRIIANLPRTSQITEISFTFGYESEVVFGPWEFRRQEPPSHRYSPIRGFQKNQQYDWFDVDSTLTFLAPRKLERVCFMIGSSWTTFSDVEEILPRVKSDGKINVEVNYAHDIEQAYW
ncbi:hypothetical protein NLJ89_g2673 [Agrocybe chaxingu]|uniref:F-box domain-containing protein n=1 Tax=Agrocybe chaxingu TaxID=84603 RepID=A0A9W8K3X7_9AGAR|nr:hypothetical protein NLJ89_g2673 [Agrocybe chaxingu]